MDRSFTYRTPGVYRHVRTHFSENHRKWCNANAKVRFYFRPRRTDWNRSESLTEKNKQTKKQNKKQNKKTVADTGDLESGRVSPNPWARSLHTVYLTCSDPPHLGWTSFAMAELLEYLERKYSAKVGMHHSHLAPVIQGSFQEAKSLVGKQLPLRTSQQLKNGEAIQLPVFDPNFRYEDVPCRHPGCKASNPDPAVLKSYGHGTKRDLYLCPKHMGAMKSRIENLFQKAGMMVPPYKQSDPEDLSDYTLLIPKLEQIYREALQGNCVPSKLFREAVLNVRNFLIIINVLLNPSDCNLCAVLPPVLRLLQRLITNDQVTCQSCNDLRRVIQHILASYRIGYDWVCLEVIDKRPGLAIGAGIGGFVGMFGGMVLGGPLGAAGMGTGGAAFGGLIGGGIEVLLTRPRPRHDFVFHGNAEGDLFVTFRFVRALGN